jgi:hypothetical protein
MPEERQHRHEIELNRFWNDLLAMGGDTEAGSLSGEDAETLRRLHAMTRTPPPERARARADAVWAVWAVTPGNGHAAIHLASTHVLARDQARSSAAEPLAPASLAAPARRWSVPRAPRSAAPFATVLLLLLTLGLAAAILVPGHPLANRWRDVPIALVAPGTDEPDVLAEATLTPVFAATLPAEMIPTAGNLDLLLWRTSIEPGAAAPASARTWPCCRGPQITHVLVGDLTVRVEGPAWVSRGSGMTQGMSEVAPGSAVVLHAGDTIVFDHELAAEYANETAQAVDFLGGGIFAGAVRNGPLGLPLIDYNEAFALPALPPGPLEATLLRAVLPPGGVVPAPAADALVLEVGAFGDADIAQGADASLRNIGPQVETIYVLTLNPLGEEGGTP